METFLIKAVQLILAFAILVIIHEFGHFLFARMFGVRVEKFYIFFNPWFSLFRYKTRHLKELEKREAEEAKSPLSLQEGPAPQSPKRKSSFWKETEYGIGWLPLGGYCKIAGMIDESMDTEQLKRDPQNWEFRSKPAWQRLLIMVAGVLFNFLLAIIIYAGIVYATGERYVPFTEARQGMLFTPAAQEAGFRNGDIPLSADGEALEHPGEARVKILQARRVDVLRGADTVAVDIPEKFIFAIDAETKAGEQPFSLMTYSIPVRITQVEKGSGAERAGIRKDDMVIRVDSVATPDIITFLDAVKGHENGTLSLTVARPGGAGSTDTLLLPVPLNENSKMGVGLETSPEAFFKVREKHYGLLASVPRGVELGVDKLTTYVGSMKMLFTKEGAQSIGGFGTIGSLFPESWDWIAFWNIAAFLSVALAFMNILPIPALDGGHVLFLLYEVITRRKPSQRFMEWTQMIGMGLLILLLLYANGMDIIRLFK